MPTDNGGATQVHRWRAFAVLAVSFFMTVVDLTIVNVALPDDRPRRCTSPNRTCSGW